MTQAVAEPAVEAGGTTRRGRPRPEATIERDKGVLERITAPKTRAALVDETGLGKNQVYLSLYRLRRGGHIERRREGGQHVWARTGEVQAEAPIPPTA